MCWIFQFQLLHKVSDATLYNSKYSFSLLFSKKDWFLEIWFDCYSLCGCISSVFLNSKGNPSVVSAFLSSCTLLQIGSVAYTVHGEFLPSGVLSLLALLRSAIIEFSHNSIFFFPLSSHVVSVWFQLLLSTIKHILESADCICLLVSLKMEFVAIFFHSLCSFHMILWREWTKKLIHAAMLLQKSLRRS